MGFETRTSSPVGFVSKMVSKKKIVSREHSRHHYSHVSSRGHIYHYSLSPFKISKQYILTCRKDNIQKIKPKTFFYLETIPKEHLQNSTKKEDHISHFIRRHFPLSIQKSGIINSICCCLLESVRQFEIF